jgi:ATP-binding cassette subfamily F protein 3
METKTLKLEKLEIENKDLYLNLHLTNVSYENNLIIFDKLDLELRGNQKVALIGKNGSGKSTILKLINEDSFKCQGIIEKHPRFKIFYYSQHFPTLMQKSSAFEYILKKYRLKEKGVISHLAGCGLPFPQQKRQFSQLSGGEKVRVLFSEIYLVKPNLLLLDEPTNHLDIESIDILIEFLQDYSGMVIISSHNRNLITSISTEIYETVDKTLNKIENFDTWLDEKKKELRKL